MLSENSLRRRSRANAEPGAFRSLDWFTIVLYLLLVTAGVISIYAASYDFDHASIWSFSEFSGKQICWIGLSLLIGAAIMLTDYRMYETYAYPFYAFMLIVLVVTIFVAPDIKGSHSWLRFGPVSVQPAEFAKCAAALALAKLFNTYNFKLNSPSNYLKAIAIFLVPSFIIICQNETGSALTFFALFFVLYREGMSGIVLLAAVIAVAIFVVIMKYAENSVLAMAQGEFIVYMLIMLVMVLMVGLFSKSVKLMRLLFLSFGGLVAIAFILGAFEIVLPWKWIFMAAIIIAAAYLVILSFRDHIRKFMVCGIFALGSLIFAFSVNTLFPLLQPHQQNRILVSLGITADPRGQGYNVNQSLIAIGSGGVTGKGFLNGTQTKLKYVPEQHTDFIFCTIGEEHGYVGTSAVLLLFLLLILRIISIAERQPTAFSRVYGYSVASIFIFHLCINVGMVIGLCPVIGIPLPFFSYGGSSLWGFTILLFILLRLDAARKLIRR